MSLSYALKKNSGFIISVIAGVVLYEHALFSGLKYYEGADNVVNALMLSMGCGRAGWNGILFPILASLPMATQYVREYKSGYLWLILERTGNWKYKMERLGKNALFGALSLLIPYLIYAFQLTLMLDTAAPLYPDHGESLAHYNPELAEAYPILYILMIALIVSVCGAVFTTFALGFSTLVKNEFLTLLLPFATCILMAMVTPDLQWDLLCTYCPNGYAKIKTSNIVVMDCIVAFLGIGLFIIGTKINERKMGSNKKG